MWKIILIEILGNSTKFFLLISIVFAFYATFYYIHCIDNKLKVSKRKIKALCITSLICISITILLPSKKFMYIAAGVNETIEFLQNNEDAKKISSKTLQLINKKLDSYLTEEEK